MHSADQDATSSATAASLAAAALKDEGNELFKSGQYSSAIEKFSAAISLEPENKIFFCNRSLCYAAQEDWAASLEDASKAVSLDAKYAKGHFRVVKAQLALQRYRECRFSLQNALKEVGESAEFKALEVEYAKKTGILVRPGPNDFEVIDELGDGNFSKIYKAKSKVTGKVYAMKVIEKKTVERMKRRHGNISNEILMEKKILNRLDHVNIVPLYSTFQDYGTLYFQMEFLSGGEVWSRLFDDRHSVGCHWSIGRFIVAEMINALEYMHQKGVVHRDLKVENIMLTDRGHIKLIDFGTAKDLIDKDLNGPEFVGTPEYMSPQTLKSKDVGVEADLWAFGVIVFQIFAGYTPFSAASPYLIFLRIKRGLLLKLPMAFPPHFLEFVKLLLDLDPMRRLDNALGVSADTRAFSSSVRYDHLRAHPFFAPLTTDIHIPAGHETYDQIQILKASSFVPAVTIPHLSEICLRIVAKSTQDIADKLAENGGIRPDIPWIKRFDLFGSRIDDQLRARMMHYLLRKQRLHPPSIYRLFQKSVIDARCLRASPVTKEYVGLCKDLQGRWEKNFCFFVLCNPQIGASSDRISTEFSEAETLRKAITAVNRSRPRFLVVMGNFTSSSCDSADSNEYQNQTVAFRKVVSKVSETISVTFVPGTNDVGIEPTSATIDNYRSLYGADYYGFWYGGMRCLVINSPLLVNPQSCVEEAAKQDAWFEEEIEQAKMCSTHVTIYSYHRWFVESIDEDDQAIRPFSDVIPLAVRIKWLKMLRQHKVRTMFASNSAVNSSRLCHPNRKQIVESALPPMPPIRPIYSGAKEDADEFLVPPKPSEIIAEAVRDGEISLRAPEADDSSSSSEDGGNDVAGDDKSESEYVNEDAEYTGPEMVSTSSVTISAGLRVLKVYEDDITHEFLAIDDIPKAICIDV